MMTFFFFSSFQGKKYDKRLRTINELCDSTNQVALDVLRYSLHVFTHRDTVAFDPFVVESSKAEQASMIKIGTTEFPVLTCVSNQMECCAVQSSSQMSSIKMFLRHFLDLHSRQKDSESTVVGSAGESLAVPGGRKEDGSVLDVGSQYFGELNSSFLSLLKYTSISLPAVRNSSSSMHSKVGSFINIPSLVEGNSPATSAMQEGNSPSNDVSQVTVHQQQSGSSNAGSENSSDSYKDALSYVEIASSNNTESGGSSSQRGGGPNYHHSISVMSSDPGSPGSPTGDGIREMLKSAKVSLLKLRDRFSFLPHVVYSFFIGRPIAVVGRENSSKWVASFVYGLASMLPVNPGKPKRVCPMMPGKLTLRDLDTYGIVGLVKTKDLKQPVPNTLRPYVSIVDLDKDTLHAPVYKGKILMEMFDPERNFSEAVLRRFIKQSWCEIISKAYVLFTTKYTHKLSDFTRYPMAAANRGALTCDQEIVAFFVDTLKLQLLHAYQDDEFSEDLSTDTMTLNTKKCETIANIYGKKMAGRPR